MSTDTTTPHHWQKLSKEPAFQAESLKGGLSADVVVIGAGLTGLFAAIELARSGAKTVLLEAATVGNAASGRNNGQVIPHHSKKAPSEIEALLGRERGEAYNRIVAEAPQQLFDFIRSHAIECDLVTNGWIQACHSAAALDRARLFHADWKAFGASVEWLDRDAIAGKIGGGDFLGGWKAHDAGFLNPYALTQGLARVAAGLGVDIRQNAAVTAIERDGAGWRVKTATGHVAAAQVLIATNASTDRFWPGLQQAVIPVRVYQIATRPLDHQQRATVLPGGEGVSDTSRDIRAFRYDSRGGIAMVGVHTLWHDAARRGRRDVTARLHALLPQIPADPADEYWEGTIGVVPDRIPKFMRLAPGVLFAGIYSGRGVAMSTAWGKAAAGLVSGRLDEARMPVPVTGLQRIAGHAVGVQVARFIHPLHRLQDRFDSRG